MTKLGHRRDNELKESTIFHLWKFMLHCSFILLQQDSAIQFLGKFAVLSMYAIIFCCENCELCLNYCDNDYN